jgi:hypothetical protein
MSRISLERRGAARLCLAPASGCRPAPPRKSGRSAPFTCGAAAATDVSRPEVRLREVEARLLRRPSSVFRHPIPAQESSRPRITRGRNRASPSLPPGEASSGPGALRSPLCTGTCIFRAGEARAAHRQAGRISDCEAWQFCLRPGRGQAREAPPARPLQGSSDTASGSCGTVAGDGRGGVS